MPDLNNFFVIFSTEEARFFMVPDLKNKILFAVAFSNLKEAQETAEIFSKNEVLSKYKDIRSITRENFKEFQKITRQVQGFELELALDQSPQVLGAWINDDMESIKGKTFASKHKQDLTYEEALQLAVEDGHITNLKKQIGNSYTYELTEEGKREVERIEKSENLMNTRLTQLLNKGSLEAIGADDHGTIYRFTGKA